MLTCSKSWNLLNVPGIFYTQAAFIIKLKKPPNFDHVQFPERRRLKVVEKVPPPLTPTKPFLKMSKHLDLMRGPEETHNRLIYGEFGVQALAGGRLKNCHFESMRTVILRRMDEKKCFATYRVEPVWQPMFKKGQGHRMGGGKGAIKSYETPVREGRIILEIGGKVEFKEVEPILKTMTHFLPFKSRVVTRDMLEKEKEEEEMLEKMNQNPFTFKYCAHKNMLGIQKWLSPYDYEWFGKYR